MKIKKLAFLAITSSLLLASCGSEGNNSAPCTSCGSNTTNSALNKSVKIAGQKIEFHYTTAVGSFASLKGYRRYIYFNTNGTYQIKTRSGIFESEGTYTYSQKNSKEGKLILNTVSGESGQTQTGIDMFYYSSKKGRFEGSIEEGNTAGKIKGRFKFKGKI